MMQPQGNPPGPYTPPKKTSPLIWILGGCGVLVFIGGIAVCVGVWLAYRGAKNYAEHALDTNSGEMKSVAQLWSDVPPLDGMAQSQQTQMPLAIRLLARPFLDTLMRGLNDGKNAGHWDVASFIANGKTTRDVEAFYVPVRMGKYGWQQQGGCANANQASFCSFQKHEGNKVTGLLIIAADDPEHKSTALYFIRQEAQETDKRPGRP